jgi:hypothetical protein
MDTICLDDIKGLIQKGEGPHVSIFMPTHHKGGIDQQDPIRLRNLLRTAEEKLVARKMRAPEARALLGQAEKLLTDNLFWRNQSDGLALFIESNKYSYYRLPVEFKEEVGIGESYSVRPLIPLVSECGSFYVLAVSKNENRLLQCTMAKSVRINLEGIPKNMVEALNSETPDSRTQTHSTGNIGGRGGGQVAIQSGEMKEINDNRNLTLYFDRINAGLVKILKAEKAPLVLAGVDYLHPLYYSVNKYPNLLAEGIKGNADGVSDDTLREQAWSIVHVSFEKARRDAIADFQKSAGKGLTTTGVSDTVPAAVGGRVRILFVADGAQEWGKFAPDTQTVTTHPKAEIDDDDLVDLAARETLVNSGTIYMMRPEEVPGAAPMVATLRF